MDAFLTQGLIGLYVLTNGLRVLSYVPQIVAVARDHSGAHAIALSTWTFWTIANATTSLYAFRVPGDVLLAVISAANAICCLTVVAIVVCKRRVQARAHRPPRMTFATTPMLVGSKDAIHRQAEVDSMISGRCRALRSDRRGGQRHGAR